MDIFFALLLLLREMNLKLLPLPAVFHPEPQPANNRHSDELSEDSRLTDAESNFRVTVFNACLDIIIQQLSQRFTSLNATVNMFEAIHPNTLLQAKDEDLHQAAQRLIEHYSRDIAASFPGQLLSFRTCFRDQIQKLKSMNGLA
ncbi:hypothetical protein F7725_023333 [Dissostichus mawsoni]|uniref:Uncharacterized protein n=1 Tax=Dissostichus mawsoni TaxID=36200 RepID=A0A7J5Z4P5_DISMA|nr:hypothetical protein F7725_023333 [Dissostichus mawsoni]